MQLVHGRAGGRTQGADSRPGALRLAVLPKVTRAPAQKVPLLQGCIWPKAEQRSSRKDPRGAHLGERKGQVGVIMEIQVDSDGGAQGASPGRDGESGTHGC